MLNQKRNLKRKSKVEAIFSEVANTSFLTLSSMIIPTVASVIIFRVVYGVWPWGDYEVHSGPGDLFAFYILCSLGYLLSLLTAWIGGNTIATKAICLTMFIMIVDNLVMALDAMDLATWDTLESFDDVLQLACGAAFMLIGVLCLITKLLRYASRYSASPSGL